MSYSIKGLGKNINIAGQRHKVDLQPYYADLAGS